MNITYWTDFTKRKNSTKQPTGGTQATVRLKEPCGIYSPTFICSGVPESIKYVKAWDRYYFVTDVTHDGPELVISCASDPLATFKSAIGSTYADVEYTSSSTNILVNDPRNHPTVQIDETSGALFDLTSYGFKQWPTTYIVGTVTDSGLRYCIMDESELQTVCNTIYSTDFVQSFNSVIYDMKNIIVSCIAIPYNPTKTVIPGGLAVDSIQLLNPAYYVGTRLVHVIQGASCTFTMPDPSGIDTHSYLDHSPYTTASLYLPYVGVVPLDMDIFAEYEKFICDMYLDICTGDIVYRISKTTGDYVATYQGNCATQVPISGTSINNPMGALASGISAIGGVAQIAAGAVSGNAALVGSGAAGVAGAAMGAAQSLSLHTQVNGSISTAIGCMVGSVAKYMVFKRRPTELNITTGFKSVSGMPYFKGATIGNLSGYVKCNGASVAINGFDADRDSVNAYLNSGFYYE